MRGTGVVAVPARRTSGLSRDHANRIRSARVNAGIQSIAEFERPPVVEVVLGVQFAESAVDLEVLAEFASAIRAEYPSRQQVEPLARATESFTRPADGPRFELRLGGSPLPRTWFVSSDQRLLVQLQGDRLILNWRRVDMGDEYPRFETLRPRFDSLRAELGAIIERLGRKRPAVDQVEVTYINELADPLNLAPDRHPALAQMLTTIAGPPSGGFLPPPEDEGYLARFRITSERAASEPMGRLLVSTDAAYRTADQAPIYLLKLTANLGGELREEAAIIESLDLGRNWIVNGFLQLTAPELHERWGLIR